MYQQAATLRKQAQTLRLGRLTTFLLLAITAAGLPGCDETDPTGTDLTTSSDGGPDSGPGRSTDGDSMALALRHRRPGEHHPVADQPDARRPPASFSVSHRPAPARPVSSKSTTPPTSSKDTILAQTNGGGGTVVSSVAVHGCPRAPSGVPASSGDQRRQLQARTHCQGQPPGHRWRIWYRQCCQRTARLLEATSAGDQVPPQCFENSRGSVATLQATNTSTGFAGLTSRNCGPAPPRGC